MPFAWALENWVPYEADDESVSAELLELELDERTCVLSEAGVRPKHRRHRVEPLGSSVTRKYSLPPYRQPHLAVHIAESRSSSSSSGACTFLVRGW